jgi:hypothetical protein
MANIRGNSSLTPFISAHKEIEFEDKLCDEYYAKANSESK